MFYGLILHCAYSLRAFNDGNLPSGEAHARVCVWYADLLCVYTIIVGVG